MKFTWDQCREFYNSNIWKELSKQCKERDNYSCKECGREAKTRQEKRCLHAHHIISRKPVPYKTTFDCLSNLKTLCNNCHSIEHKRPILQSKKSAPPKIFRARRFGKWKS
jgi:5-methylcytosine-specific restriction endonuclease McrA